ncbi:hypothetical protein CPB84DRAFT_1853843 [Gymnopilus junonius]|uniref:26S proteasome regulatory subunit RPN2 C-terminal domain-containing protein n=1 Tax=Gymnopilus junonius TaxID=109634 RepID=A0A9P5NA43_GYMJU|nr:hypothetical protein CPB84DRAFT_1853843 [Gymnopilus junonius]
MQCIDKAQAAAIYTQYTLALAYAGTASNDAVGNCTVPSPTPLTIAPCRATHERKQCNPFVLSGIVHAKTGLQGAIEILEPMMKNSVEFAADAAAAAVSGERSADAAAAAGTGADAATAISSERVNGDAVGMDGHQTGRESRRENEERRSLPKDGDVSPVYLSVLNIADTDQASTSKPKKTEPASELHPNFSRVTPAQLPYISFSSNGRCQPMRAVSAKVLLSSKNVKAAVRDTSVALGSGSEKYAGGGGILNLTDLRPNEEPEYIERQTVPAPAAPEAAPTANADVRSQPPTYRSPYCSG